MSGFDARSLERGFAFLGDCPPHLFAEVVTLPDGTLEARVAGVRRWREALLAGQLPAPGGWPDDTVAGPARSALEALDVARFCRDNPELTDAVLADVVRSFGQRGAALRDEVTRRLRELDALERKRLDDEERDRARHERRSARAMKLDAATLEALRAKALAEIAARPPQPDAAVHDAWAERARAWRAVADIFGDLGQLLGRGWDLTRGVLRHTGWRDLVALQRLAAQLPQLREVVRSLGRLRASDAGAPVSEQVFGPIRRLDEERREVRTPHVPAEVRGVERSAEIARMLPAEAALLGHPVLAALWHARRMERALLTYRVEGVAFARVVVEREAAGERTATKPRPERGPILVVIDTSGSMEGLPERVAKAVALEALRTAHAERRRCFLYAFSGPGQVLEQELDLSEKGVGALLSFLAASFGGGSDAHTVVERVLSRLREEAWSKADVLFVSDGEWPAPTALRAEVARAKADGTRFHGVQIGNVGETGLHAVCDPVHVFRDWAALAR